MVYTSLMSPEYGMKNLVMCTMTLCIIWYMVYVCYICFSSGRIDRKIEFPLPDEKTRRRIFQIHTKKMTLAEDLDLEEYITAKDDLSGADIKVCACTCDSWG